MKKIFLLFTILGFITAVQGQMLHKAVQNPVKKNIALSRPMAKAIDSPDHFLVQESHPSVKSAIAISEATIGTTRYDLQTNQSTQNRIFRFNDGTISATWTMGFSETAFPERGTGYNYFDGSSWGPEPTTRIENVRTGWPSIFAFGANGEGVISHDFGTPGGLVLSKRTTKGTGAWVQNTVPGPTGQNGLSWPRAVSNGSGNTNIHTIAITRPVANSGTLYQGMDGALLYSRSTDGGATWGIANQILPGMTSDTYVGFGGDSYAWAEPKGNTLAFVVGDNWNDIILMKSTDNGSSWTKTVIFQHPYPKFVETHTIVADTPTVCDGALAVTIDNSGNAHVFFGIMRVLNEDTTDAQTTYFPYSDGLVYWHEGMPAFPTLTYNTLWDNNNLVGYLQDMNGNDTVMEFIDIGLYYLSLTSMPYASCDEQGNIFLAFTSVMENLDNGAQNYRHVWARALPAGATEWSAFKDLTGSIIHNFHECVSPSMSANSSDNMLHLVYQYDDEPGLAVRGDADAYTDNTISYMGVTKSELGLSVNDLPQDQNAISQNYPNPFKGTSSFIIQIKTAANVSVKITNMLGQEMSSKNYGLMTTGGHTLTLDASNLTSGLYFYTVTIGKSEYTHRMIVE